MRDEGATPTQIASALQAWGWPGRADVVRHLDDCKQALVKIAHWCGPGNDAARVIACRALGVDPRLHHEFDYPPRGFAPLESEPL